MAKNPKAADGASVPVSGTEEAPAASAAVGASSPDGASAPDPDADAAAEAELRRLEDEALAQAQRDAAAEEAPAGKVYLIAPDGISGASVGGVEYQVDERGEIAADPAHVPALLEHGFLLGE